jgi:hypothetical protein
MISRSSRDFLKQFAFVGKISLALKEIWGGF